MSDESTKPTESTESTDAESGSGPEVVIGEPGDIVVEESPYVYGPGDMILIHSNHGAYIAIVEKGYPNLQDAEAGYSGSFQTIMKRGPLYSATAPHYLCFINNHGERPIGASEPDTSLKAKSEEY
jgi:hypothetical protein